MHALHLFTANPNPIDTLNNPDTLTKYKDAGIISHKVLEAVSKLCVAGEKIVEICEKGDKLLDEEIAKVYRGKKIAKGKLFELFVACASLLTRYRHFTPNHRLSRCFRHPIHPIEVG